MPEKAPFKTGRIYRFLNGSAANNARIVRLFCKGKSAKSSDLDRETASLTNRRKSGCKTELFFKYFAVFFECRFSVPAPEFHRSVVLLAPIGEVVAESYPIRAVIQLSNYPSIGRQREGPKINPLCNIFSMSTTTKRAGTQHIKSAGENLSLYL